MLCPILYNRTIIPTKVTMFWWWEITIHFTFCLYLIFAIVISTRPHLILGSTFGGKEKVKQSKIINKNSRKSMQTRENLMMKMILYQIFTMSGTYVSEGPHLCLWSLRFKNQYVRRQKPLQCCNQQLIKNHKAIEIISGCKVGPCCSWP